ncbi:hypothetical protein GQ457_06G005300 [Hibiscus cannabinus]
MGKIEWQKVVWYPLHVPKHSIAAWMAILNRLPTRDRLICIGMNVESSCLFCQVNAETRDHLFASCSYAKGIWVSILRLCNIQRDAYSWQENFNGSVKEKVRALLSCILRVARMEGEELKAIYGLLF